MSENGKTLSFPSRLKGISVDPIPILNDVIKGGVAFVLGGGVFSTLLAFRKDRREAPKSTSDTLKSILDQATEATATAMDALSKAQDSQAKALEAEKRSITAERTVTTFRNIITSHFVPILEWIDGGAPPPPPNINPELRSFVNDMSDER